MVLVFHTHELEQTYASRRNLQLLRQDVSWAFFWLLFGGAGFNKSLHTAQWHYLQEMLILAAYTAWSPLLMYLIHFRTGWYLRHRHNFIIVMRITRTLLLMSELPRRENIWVGSPESVGTAAFYTPFSIYVHLCWKVNSLLIASMSLILPMRFHLPIHLLFMLLKLRSNGLRCRLECTGGSGGMGTGLGGSGHGSQMGALAQACGSGLGGAAAGQLGAASCGLQEGGSCLAGANGTLVGQYYSTAASWIRWLVPPAAWLPASWRLDAGSGNRSSCMHSCFAVHGWLQTVGGVLFPLALLWAWEERLRARELRMWQEERQRQAPEQQEGECAAGLLGCRQPWVPQYQRPLPFTHLFAWFASSAWLLWLLLEMLLL